MDILDLYTYEHMQFDHTREQIPDSTQFYMHIHTDMEIFYLIEGKVEYHVETSIYQLRPGDMMIMRPGEAHTSLSDCSGPYERFNLRFAPELLKESLNSRLLQPFLDRPLGTSNHYTAADIPSDYIRASFDRMFAAGQGGQRRAMTYLLPILQEIYDVWIARKNKPQNPSVSLPARIISYINQHLTQLQDPQQLSDAFYLSQSQINRVFRAYTGTSVWDYVRTKRLFAARDLLFSGVMPNEAASACGYPSYSTFFRAYKKQFGHSPKEDFGAGKLSENIEIRRYEKILPNPGRIFHFGKIG